MTIESNESPLSLWLRALRVSFVFFSRLPMPAIDRIAPADNGRALVLLPVVGLAIGALLYLTAALLSAHLPSLVLAALLLSLWVGLTGGLHLDGLADSADGWLGGFGDVHKTLEIMHDSRSGAGAVMAVGCLLLLKFAALAALLDQAVGIALLLAPVLGRACSCALFLTTPAVRAEGMAREFSEQAPRHLLMAMIVAAVILAAVLLGPGTAALTVLLAGTLLALLRRMMLKRLEGLTGDTAGATVEVIEAAVLIALCLS